MRAHTKIEVVGNDGTKTARFCLDCQNQGILVKTASDVPAAKEDYSGNPGSVVRVENDG